MRIPLDNRRGIVYVIGFLDLLAVSVAIPALPVYLKHLGASSTLSGAITSVYGALQLFSSPMVGKWSDKKGRIEMLSVCLLVCASGYLSLALVMKHLIWISVARVVPGLFKHTQDLSRCLLLDEGETQKNQLLGTFNAISSIGFIIGPTVHGHLVAYFGIDRGFFISTIICSILFVMNFFIVSTLAYQYEVGKKDKNSIQKTIDRDNVSGMAANGTGKRASTSWKFSQFHQGILATRFLLAFGVMIFRSSFVLWLNHYHPDLPATKIGYILSFNGFLGLSCGFIVGPISNLEVYKNNEEKLQFHATLLLIFSLTIPILSTNIIMILIALSAITMATSMLRVCGVVLSVKNLSKSDIGHVQGLGSSVISVARFAAPLTTGILQETSYSAPNQASFALCLVGVAVYYQFSYLKSSEIKNQK